MSKIKRYRLDKTPPFIHNAKKLRGAKQEVRHERTD